ncbi:hypothetical protein [Sphingomonas oryzagri]
MIPLQQKIAQALMRRCCGRPDARTKPAPRSPFFMLPPGAGLPAEEQTLMAEQADHTHILRSWHEWELGGRERRIVLVVETDVEMRPEADAFDADLMEEVRQAALAEMSASPCAIHLVRIVPFRD